MALKEPLKFCKDIGRQAQIHERAKGILRTKSGVRGWIPSQIHTIELKKVGDKQLYHVVTLSPTFLVVTSFRVKSFLGVKTKTFGQKFFGLL